jgi:hypothetical protein
LDRALAFARVHTQTVEEVPSEIQSFIQGAVRSLLDVAKRKIREGKFQEAAAATSAVIMRSTISTEVRSAIENVTKIDTTLARFNRERDLPEGCHFERLTPEHITPEVMREHGRQGEKKIIIPYTREQIIHQFIDNPFGAAAAVIDKEGKVRAIVYGTIEPGDTEDTAATYAKKNMVSTIDEFNRRKANKEAATLLLRPDDKSVVDGSKISQREYGFTRMETLLVVDKNDRNNPQLQFGIRAQKAFEGIANAKEGSRCYREASPDAIPALMHAFKNGGKLTALEGYFSEEDGKYHTYLIFTSSPDPKDYNPKSAEAIAERKESLKKLEEQGVKLSEAALKAAVEHGYLLQNHGLTPAPQE